MKKQSNYPLYEVTPFSNIKEMLYIAEKEAGSDIAFKYKDKSNNVIEVTYKQFRADTHSLGSALTALGLNNLHVACIGNNSYPWVTAYLTMLGSAGVFVPIDKELPSEDIINVINHSDSEAMFYSGEYEKNLLNNLDLLSKIKVFIGFDRMEDSEDGRFLSYKKLLKHGYSMIADGDTSYIEQKSDPHELKLLVYTSGTTGLSKGVMLSEHNLVSCVYYGLQVSTVYDTCLSVLPYHHTYEAVCGLLVGLHMHATICINEKLRAVLNNLQLYKPSYLYLVPAFTEVFYKKIWATAEKEKKDKALRILIKISNFLRKFGIDMRRKFFASIHSVFGGRLCKIVCGGAPIRPEIGEFFDDIGINLINGYGITECSPLVTANRDYFNDWNTTGVKLPCIDIKIADINEDGIGEICVKGDTVMLGYYKNEAETARCMKDGWFYTGDYGYLNEKEQLVITGRKKNLIVLDNGKNVYPEEIENYIYSIPYVKEVIVKGLKDESGGEKALCAEVYLDDDELTEMKVLNPIETLKRDVTALLSKLPSYKRIQEFIVRSTEFDKTTSKKIKRGN
ncbi:MAG TPA: AMP-binding protein [Clostridiaceae bacterium]|jgi:long-chain acyl-CoA synthetase|nr:AMP-binding protein [Clostridiaceae bacterium]